MSLMPFAHYIAGDAIEAEFGGVDTDTTNSTASFSLSLDFGPSNANGKLAVVCLHWAGFSTNDFSSVTIDGNAATLERGSGSSLRTSAIYAVDVGSASGTLTVSVTMTDSRFSNYLLGRACYIYNNASDTDDGSDGDLVFGSGDDGQMSITLSGLTGGGVAIATGQLGAVGTSPPAPTWGNVSETVDDSNDTREEIIATAILRDCGTSETITLADSTDTSVNYPKLLGAAWV